VGDLDGTDSEDESDRMIPTTTILCEIGWNFNEFRHAVAACSHRVAVTIPIHPQEAVPEALLSKGLRKPRGKRR
jgi:hypothetical protein